VTGAVRAFCWLSMCVVNLGRSLWWPGKHHPTTGCLLPAWLLVGRPWTACIGWGRRALSTSTNTGELVGWTLLDMVSAALVHFEVSYMPRTALLP
jgi:hypothetical protein